MRRALGWPRPKHPLLQGLGMAVLIAGFFLLLAVFVGVPLVWLSDGIGALP